MKKILSIITSLLCGSCALPLHGMDTCFGDENYLLAHDFISGRGSMVGGALMRCQQGPPMYWARLKSLHETVLLKEDWSARILFAGNRLRDAIALKDPKRAEVYAGTVRQASIRIPRRIAAVGRQLQEPVKPIFVAKAGVKIPKNWMFDASGGGQGDEVRMDGRYCLHLVATEKSTPSWRLKLQLEPGRYRVGALGGVRGVDATEDEIGRGAGLRISGAPKRANVWEGDGGFNPGVPGGQSMSYEFVTPGGEVELIFELRATKGEAWLARETIGLTGGNNLGERLETIARKTVRFDLHESQAAKEFSFTRSVHCTPQSRTGVDPMRSPGVFVPSRDWRERGEASAAAG